MRRRLDFIAACGAVALAIPIVYAADGKPLRFQLSNTPFVGQVVSIDVDGRGVVNRIQNEEAYSIRVPISEGHYLAICGQPDELPVGAKLTRVEILEVRAGDALDVRFPKSAAAKIRVNELLMLDRPVKSTTAELKNVPDGPLEIGAFKGPGTPAAIRGTMAQSKNNMKQMLLALHNYHDTHRMFPPASIKGPDGKPWHSWRVLILPFMEEGKLYKEYRFDEPWDGPNNKKLIDKMPSWYSDPVHGENKEHFTHYVAITGDGTAFPKRGTLNGNLPERPGGGLRIADITDGTSNTILLGLAGPKHKIPWSKPEDIVVSTKFPPIGQGLSLAAPYQTDDNKPATLLGMADGSVPLLPAGITPTTFQALVSPAGGERVDLSTIANNPEHVRNSRVLYVDPTKNEASAQFEAVSDD